MLAGSRQRGATCARDADREKTVRDLAAGGGAETWTGDIVDFRRQQVADVYLRAVAGPGDYHSAPTVIQVVINRARECTFGVLFACYSTC